VYSFEYTFFKFNVFFEFMVRCRIVLEVGGEKFIENFVMLIQRKTSLQIVGKNGSGKSNIFDGI